MDTLARQTEMRSLERETGRAARWCALALALRWLVSAGTDPAIDDAAWRSEPGGCAYDGSWRVGCDYASDIAQVMSFLGATGDVVAVLSQRHAQLAYSPGMGAKKHRKLTVHLHFDLESPEQ